MGIRVPIQAREQAQIQDNSPVYNQSEITQPIKTDLGAPLDKYASAVKERQDQVAKRTYQFLKARVNNDIDSHVNEAAQQVVSAEGENSFSAADKAQQKLTENLGKTLINIPVEYRQEFSVYADQGIRRFNKTSQGHQYSEQKKVVDATFKARANSLTDTAALNAYDTSAFEENLNALDQVTDEYTRNTLGGNPDTGMPASPKVQEAIDTQKRAAKSAAIYKTVQTLVASEDTDTASSLAQKYKDFVTAEDATRIYGLLRKGRINDKSNKAKAIFEEAMNQFPGNETKGMTYIQHSTEDGDIYKEAAGMFRNRIAFNEQQRKALSDKTFADAMTALRKNGGQITSEVLKSIDPEKKADLVEYAQKVTRGELIPRNGRTYNNLMNMYLTQPDRFGNQVNMQSYVNQMPLSDINHFEQLQREVRDPNTTKVTQASVNDITANIIRSEVATQYKYTSDEYKQRSAAIHSLAMQTLAEVKAGLPERSATEKVREEFQKAMSLKTRKLENQTSWWDRTTHSLNKDWGAPDNFQAAPANETNLKDEDYNINATTSFNNYDPSDVEQIRSQYQSRKGKTPSDVELLKTLRTLKQRGYIK